MTLPPNILYPSSIECRNGNVRYTLEANVHRSGLLSPKLQATIPITLVNVGPRRTTVFDSVLMHGTLDTEGIDTRLMEWNVECGSECVVGDEVPLNVKVRLEHGVCLSEVKIVLRGTNALSSPEMTQSLTCIARQQKRVRLNSPKPFLTVSRKTY